MWSPEGTESGSQWYVNPGKDLTSQWERRMYKPRQVRGCGRGDRAGGRKFTVLALGQTVLPRPAVPDFFQFPQDALVHQEDVQGPDCPLLTPARLRNTGPS